MFSLGLMPCGLVGHNPEEQHQHCRHYHRHIGKTTLMLFVTSLCQLGKSICKGCLSLFTKLEVMII